jgi:hypothetical protein
MFFGFDAIKSEYIDAPYIEVYRNRRGRGETLRLVGVEKYSCVDPCDLLLIYVI